MKKRYSVAGLIFALCLVVPISIFGRDIVVFNAEKAPVGGASVTLYNAARDSIGSAMTSEQGILELYNSAARILMIEHPDYSSLLVNVDDLPNDTVILKPAVALKEVVVEESNVTQHLTHLSYKIPVSAMKSYSTFYQALNEIPNLVVLRTGALFYEGNTNVKLLLNGVETTSAELSSLAKGDIYKVDVYQIPPARFMAEGASSVIDIITKDTLTGGNFSVNADQSFFPLMGENSAALYYNYKRSRFSVLYSNENTHNKKFRQSEELDYEHDGVKYSKRKRGLDSKNHIDENSLSLSFQNNLRDSYLYKLTVGGVVNRENQSLNQEVYSNQLAEIHRAVRKLNTRFDRMWVRNYFEKNLGDKGDGGTVLANVKWQRSFSKYFSSYNEFDAESIDKIYVDESSAYKIRYDAVFGEAQYMLPSKSWGSLALVAYDSYKYSKYLDTSSGIYQRNNIFGVMMQYYARKGKFFYMALMGLNGYNTSSSSMETSYNMWLPSPTIYISYNPSRMWQLRFNYRYAGNTPSIADLSETDQWLDTKLVYHGNSMLKPYKDHSLNLTGVTDTKYINASLSLSYQYSPDMLCHYFKNTPDYVLETIVNLEHYSVMSGQLDVTFKPLGSNQWTMWSRLIGAKVHGRGEEYKWDGYRFQWMVNTRINLPKWTFEAFYQYPGKVAEGQLVRPRAQFWQVSAEFRPIEDLSVGLTWYQPFGNNFKESERTVGSALVHNNFITEVVDRANRIGISVSWNVSFGKNKNHASPQIDNGDNDTGILKK